MSFETIIVENKASVGVITLNRVSSMNAVCASMLFELGVALTQFDTEETIRVVVLKGSDAFFAGGTDMSEFASKAPTSYVKEGLYGQSISQITNFKKPLISAVSGYAFGGGLELVLMSDIVLASDSARFGFPELSLGILPQMGGIARLVARVGRAKAMEMVLSGRHLSATEALEAGLVSRLTSTQSLVSEAVHTAERIAQLPLAGVLLAKQAVLAGAEHLENACKSEEMIARMSLMSVDAQEALKALIEKRAPKFQHQ